MGNVFERFGQFVEEVRYVRQGDPLPEGFTHTFKLANAANTRDLVFAVKFRAEVAPVIDLILSFV